MTEALTTGQKDELEGALRDALLLSPAYDMVDPSDAVEVVSQWLYEAGILGEVQP